MEEDQVIIDIKVDSKEIKIAENRVDDLTNSIEDLAKEIKDAGNNNKKYKKTLADLDKQLDEGTISLEAHAKQTKLLKKEIDENNKTIAEGSIELSKQKRERTANIKLINSEANSRDQLRQKVAILSREYNSLNLETKEGRDRSEELEKTLKELNETINKGSLAAGNFKDNIGNYPEVSKEAQISLEKLGNGLDNVGGASANAAGGIRTIGAAFKALLANPIVALIAAIVTGLKFLFDAFKKSASGSRILGKAAAALRGIFALITRAANTLGEVLERIWDDPKKAAEDFGKSLEENISKRLKGFVALFKGIGAQISALFSGDMEEMQRAAAETQAAFNQMATGMNETELNEYAKEVAEARKETERLKQAFIDLEEAQRVNRGVVRSLEREVARATVTFEKLSEAAGDDTMNMQEMRQAAIDAGKAASDLADKQVRLAQARLSVISKEVSVRRSAGEEIQDLLDAQVQAEVALTEARGQAAIAQQKILIEQRKIERDIFEQNLDILIDVGDKIKTEQERQIANESLSLAKRRELLNASRAALTANFGEIKKEYELYGVTAEQINDVINASDAKQANEKLKALGLNEIANNRLREIILERRQAELDFADISKELSDEEIERKQSANETIQGIDEDFYLSQIENAEDLRDALIDLENEKLEKKLENENLLAIEREALIAQTEANIREIENEFAEEKKEKDEDDFEERKEIIEDRLEELIEITQDFAGEEAAIFGKIALSIGEAFQDGKITATEALMGISKVSNAVFDGLTERRNEDLSNLENARKKELELAQGNAEAQDAINIEYDKRSADLKRKQFKADKAKALIDIAIATATGAAKALPNILLAGIVTAFGVAQGAIVASKKPPKFAKGTSDIVSIGDSHASGNDVDIYGYSGGKSQYFGKVEKGEAMPVIKKSAVNDYLISRLNGNFSNSNRVFQNGTNDIVPQAQNNDVFVSQLVNAISDIQIITKIEDVTKAARKKVQVVDNSRV